LTPERKNETAEKPKMFKEMKKPIEKNKSNGCEPVKSKR
jgi:hypothetical protein